ncbi:MAG: adenylate/guanylate cyclase domain-containing protein [Myxococcales bacterium]|nr:adenylate/guanylate cyclase domain-containing protein [Myxococcales bacterium]
MTEPEHSLLEARIFERELDRELLAMERLRATLTAAFIAFTVVFLALVFAIRAADFEAALRYPASRWLLLLAPALYIPVVLALRRHIDRRAAAHLPVDRWRRYAAAVFEISLPTIATALFVELAGPAAGLHSPPVMLYPLLIVLWTLALDWRVCLVAGFVGAAQFFALFAANAPALAAEQPNSVLSATAPFVIRATIIMATGVIAALVASQLRRRVIASLRAAHSQARLRRVFGQHVSPEIVEAILDRGAADEPTSRQVCVMFFDVRGFTSFAESHTPAEVVAFLDRLFAPLLEEVSRHGGVVNKLLGDGFMAIFGAPVDDPQPEASAIAAARALLEIVDDLVARGVLPPTEVGVGLHAGPAITGNVGSERRKEYTVIGDTVNLASRIEGLNKRFGARILASVAVVEAAGVVDACEPLGAVEIRGRAEPATLFRLA